MKVFVVIFTYLILASPVSAGVYKWIDKNGKTHYTNDLSSIPVDDRNKKDISKMGSRVESEYRSLKWAPDSKTKVKKKSEWKPPTKDRWGKTKSDYAREKRESNFKRWRRNRGTIGSSSTPTLNR